MHYFNASLRAILAAFLIAIVSIVVSQKALTQEMIPGCPLEPVSLPLFNATPAAEIESAGATPASADDSGRTGSDEDIAEFESAIAVLLACINTENPALANAVFTERYLASWFADPTVHYQPAFERTIAEGSPGAQDRQPLELAGVEEVRVLDDGRLSGRVVLQSAGVTWRDTLVLRQVADIWLIDDVILESAGNETGSRTASKRSETQE